ncbi:hypothetical protein B5S28_g2487 [[Candida] boidinii]|nr:hypothetical protein B5S28_g2487 [[Candida] boidinii]OWB59303.1 hypothetical protein B5S29_g158 [[Candida] boidinii]OWB75992.1 hypothetical protein B5S32_g139 [[Candida] boidinii]
MLKDSTISQEDDLSELTPTSKSSLSPDTQETSASFSSSKVLNSSSSKIVKPNSDTQKAIRDVACTCCRAKKVRCDKLSPRCTRCQQRNLECLYKEPRKSGPKTGRNKEKKELLKAQQQKDIETSNLHSSDDLNKKTTNSKQDPKNTSSSQENSAYSLLPPFEKVKMNVPNVPIREKIKNDILGFDLTNEDVDVLNSFCFQYPCGMVAKRNYYYHFRYKPESIIHLVFMSWALHSLNENTYKDKSEAFYTAAIEHLNDYWGRQNDTSDNFDHCGYLQCLCFKAHFEYKTGRGIQSALTIASAIRICQLFGYDCIDSETEEGFYCYKQPYDALFSASENGGTLSLDDFAGGKYNEYKNSEYRAADDMFNVTQRLEKDKWAWQDNHSQQASDSNNTTNTTDSTAETDAWFGTFNFDTSEDSEPEMSRIEESRRTFWQVYCMDRYYSLVSGHPCSLYNDKITRIYTRLPCTGIFNDSSDSKEDYLHQAMAKLEANELLLDTGFFTSEILILTFSEAIIRWCKNFTMTTEAVMLQDDEYIDYIRNKIEAIAGKFKGLSKNLISFQLVYSEGFNELVLTNTDIILYQSLLKKFSDLTLKTQSLSSKSLELYEFCLQTCMQVSQEVVKKFISYDDDEFCTLIVRTPYFITLSTAVKSAIQCLALSKRFSSFDTFGSLKFHGLYQSIQIFKIKLLNAVNISLMCKKFENFLDVRLKELDNNPEAISFHPYGFVK